MENTLVQASLGAVVGWTMGSARIGRPTSASLRFYDPVPLRMSAGAPLDAWIVACRSIKREVPLPLLAGQYAAGWHYHDGASGFGLANFERGVPPPLCGSLDNPLASSSSAIGRAVFWGLVFWGNGAKAVEAAAWDACYDHSGEGVNCAAAVAWLVANAGLGYDRKALVETLLTLLPKGSDFSRAWPHISTFFAQPDGALNTRNGVRNLGLTDAGLALSEICAAFGQSTRFGTGLGNVVVGDANRATTGLVVGALEALEYDGVPADWSAPLAESYVVGHGLTGIDAPSTLSDFTQMVVGARLMANPEASAALVAQPVESQEEPAQEANTEPAPEQVQETPVESEPTQPVASTEAAAQEAPAEPEPTEVATPETPAEPEAKSEAPKGKAPAVPEALRTRLAESANSCHAALTDLDLTVRYIDSIKAIPGRPLALDLRIKARGDHEVETQASIQPPQGWPIASRLQEFRAQPNTEASFPTILQVPESWNGQPQTLLVTLNSTEVGIPLLSESDWAVVGPFNNGEGIGHDKVYSPEMKQEPGQTFGSRSGIPIHWERWNSRNFEGIVAEQPGVLYLYTQLGFARPGEITIICGAKGSVKLWLDGKLVINCRDSRGVDVENPGSFSGTTEVGTTATCLIKLSRGAEPLGPLTLVFRDDIGAVIFPAALQRLVTK